MWMFEDGYENIFFSDIETGNGLWSRNLHTSLAKAVGKLVAANE